MACKTESKIIDDVEYSVTQWSASKAMLMKMNLIKLLGGAISNLIPPKGSNTESEVDIGKAINALFDTTSPDEAVTLIKSCIVGVAVDGKKVTETSFDQYFDADSLFTIYKVFIFVIQVNYGNFLKGQRVQDLLTKVGKNL